MAIVVYTIGIANADMVTNRLENDLKKKTAVSKTYDSNIDDELKNPFTDNPYLDNLLNIISPANHMHAATALDHLPEGVNTDKLETYEYVRKNNTAIEVFENDEFVFNYINHRGDIIHLPESVKIWHDSGIVAAMKINDKIYPFRWFFMHGAVDAAETGIMDQNKALEMVANEIFMNFTAYQIDVSTMLTTGKTAHVDDVDKRDYLKTKVYPELTSK